LAAWAATYQAQASSKQAEVAEQSFREQVRNLREQNERARLNLEADLLVRFDERWKNQLSLIQRRNAARYLIDNDTVIAPRLNDAMEYVCGFFETVGYFQSLGALQPESVWHEFGAHIRYSWAAFGPAIEKARKEWDDPELYREFERLNGLMADLDRERSVPDLTQEQVRSFFEDQTVLGEATTIKNSTAARRIRKALWGRE
jgi:hypothetical protein